MASVPDGPEGLTWRRHCCSTLENEVLPRKKKRKVIADASQCEPMWEQLRLLSHLTGVGSVAAERGTKDFSDKVRNLDFFL